MLATGDSVDSIENEGEDFEIEKRTMETSDIPDA